MIILPNAMPPVKDLCKKAQAQGIQCTVDRCDHGGGYLVLLIENTAFQSDQQSPCKTCSAEPDASDVLPEKLPSNIQCLDR